MRVLGEKWLIISGLQTRKQFRVDVSACSWLAIGFCISRETCIPVFTMMTVSLPIGHGSYNR
ncbi:hypothetical protein PHPALM_27824 [Phytophthora palmivora]|uniref:Uncharacterized protein n=1 Tax=Phytophthora palmivora TaxID=4796 RepID=A0A2P4XBQ4_9STRA|nr:hypothetical protein PHPALM_27824 [Phytophthora palmivora]